MSRFLRPLKRGFVASLLNFCFCNQDKFVMAVTPGHAHLPAFKVLHHDKFLAPRQLVPRHCSSAHLQTFCYRDNFSATHQLCTATRVMLNKICTWTAKTRAIPSLPAGRQGLHRDPSLRSGLLAKVPVFKPMLASGNTPLLRHAGSFAKMIHRIIFSRSALLPGR